MIRGRARQVGETLLTRIALAWIPGLPRERVLRLADQLGRLAYRWARQLRTVGEANLALAFGDSLDAARREEILRSSFRSFALVILDTFWFSRDTAQRIADWVKFDEAGLAPMLRPASQICITAHLGNWEVLGMAFSARGFPLVSVAAPLDNPSVDRLFNDLRNRTGQQVISKHGALRHLLKTLRGQGKVAMLLDQNTKPSAGGVFVPFFGRKVPVSTAAAALWQRTGAEIVVGACLPAPDGRYEVPAPRFLSTGDPEDRSPEALAALTADITEATEQLVRRHPGNWLWMYKRWKYVAPGEDRGAYPYYAKLLPPA